jgi:endonuclease YncB( thermonuclease family)
MFKISKIIKSLKKTWVILPLLLAGIVVVAKLSPRNTYRLLAAAGLVNFDSQHFQLVEGSIKDGNTLRVTNGKKELNIELCGIDVPETEQALGIESRDHLRKLVAQGKGHVILVFTGPNVSGKTSAEAFVPTASSHEEIHLSSQMLADGMASLSPEYLEICPNGARFVVAEDIAKQKAIGFWSQPVSQKPKSSQQ